MSKDALLKFLYRRGDILFAAYSDLTAYIICPAKMKDDKPMPSDQRSYNGGKGFFFYADSIVDDEFFYIITARQFVRSCDLKEKFQVGIFHFSAPFALLSATLFAEHPTRDFAILRVKKSAGLMRIPTELKNKEVQFHAAKIAKTPPRENDIVWGFSRFHYYLGYIETVYADKQYFIINGFPVEFGDGGIPVLNEQEEIIGMVVGFQYPFFQKSARVAAMRITKKEVLELLKKLPR